MTSPDNASHLTTKKITIERTYRTSPERVWTLWTTPEGIESWWAPDGFTERVQQLDLRPEGELVYTMTATAREQIEFLNSVGLPLTTQSRKTFVEVAPASRLSYRAARDLTLAPPCQASAMGSEMITAAAAGTWTLGDLTVNRIGFGAMRLTGSGAFHSGTPSDRNRATSVLRRAIELGVNHIDTAAFYFSSLRSANELINSALAPYPEDLVIATKVGPGRDSSGDWLPWARPEQLRGQVEENLRQLGRDHLDLVNLRLQGARSIADHFGALADLRQAGLIRHLGLSNARAEHVAEAQTIAPVVCVQNAYGLGYRPASDDFVRDCGAHGIAFVPFFSIAGSRREDGAGAAEHEEVLAIARAHGASAAQVRLAWTLQRGPHVLAIPGTGNQDHLVDNVAAGALRLSADELACMEAVHQRGDA